MHRRSGTAEKIKKRRVKMDLKDAIVSVTVSDGISKKTNQPYTCAIVLIKATNGTLITKRFFIQDYEKPLLGL